MVGSFSFIDWQTVQFLVRAFLCLAFSYVVRGVLSVVSSVLTQKVGGKGSASYCVAAGFVHRACRYECRG